MVPVNFSASSQGNATWVILVTTNNEHEEEIEEDTFATRGGEEGICQNIF